MLRLGVGGLVIVPLLHALFYHDDDSEVREDGIERGPCTGPRCARRRPLRRRLPLRRRPRDAQRRYSAASSAVTKLPRTRSCHRATPAPRRAWACRD